MRYYLYMIELFPRRIGCLGEVKCSKGSVPLQILHSVRNDVLLAAAADFLQAHSAEGEVVVVGPTRDAADDLVRSATTNALIGVHRITLDYLAAAIAQHELVAREYAPLSALAHEALAARAIQKARQDSKLDYFAPVAAFPGFPRALAATLRDLRLGRIAPTHLLTIGGAGIDLAHLLELYESELAEHRLTDQETRFAAATDIAAHGQHPLCGLPLLLLDVPIESQAAGEFISAVAGKAPAVLILPNSSVVQVWEQLFGVSSTEIRLDTSNCLTSAQNHLFTTDIVSTRPRDNTCSLFSAPGPALEAVEIVRLIRDAARDGMPFDEMAILIRKPGHYQQVVEEALRRAKIPAHFTRGTRRPEASGRAFLALLHCALERLTASRFAEYLSLGQVPDREDGEVRAPAGWERLIVDASVIGGADRWRRRLDGLEQEIAVRYASQPESDEAARNHLRRELDRLIELKDFALPLIERLAGLPARATWAEWLPLLYDLATCTLRNPEVVVELLDELQIMKEAPETEPLESIVRVLNEHLRFLRDAPEDYRYGRVFVSGIEEARGMRFRLVAIPGLNEGDFPRLITGDPLLADDRKRELGLEVKDERQEQLLLRTALACASERVIASYSEVDLMSGRKRVLSLYAAELMKAARGSDLDIRRLEEEAVNARQSKAGWPAPRNPQDAIDDAEFDLAVLRNAAKGDGAYLTKINLHLPRALRARGRRWRTAWFSEDGLVELDLEAQEILKGYRLGSHAYSPSALQQYAVCPYRFALRAIFKLQPAEQPVELQRMDPAIRGSLYHDAQFAFLRSRPAKTLDACLDEIAAEYEDRLSPAIPHMWRSEVEAIRTDLNGWAKKMEMAPEWSPVAFELSFGLPPDAHHDPNSRVEAVTVLDECKLRGSIDMVERHTSGMVRVVDHKTGGVPSPIPQFVGKGEVLQPLLYSLAAEQMLGEGVVTGRLHYATMRCNYREIDVPLNQVSRGIARLALGLIDKGVKDGFLPAAPRPNACDSCDYRVVCGPYEEERTGKKSKPELKDVRQLRGMK
jgi:CRISPR/Cas system-associated exonuclease Cas4 (RecB family)